MAKGGAKKDRIETLDKQITEELEEWGKNGMEPKNLQINEFLVDCQVKAIIKILTDKGLIDKEELNIIYKETTLDTLKEAREMLTPAVQEARLRAMIEVPEGMYPDGNQQ